MFCMLASLKRLRSGLPACLVPCLSLSLSLLPLLLSAVIGLFVQAVQAEHRDGSEITKDFL